MKYLFLFIGLSFSFGALAQKGKNGKKDLAPGVHGSIIGGAGKMLYLLKNVDKKQMNIDSVMVDEDDSFHLVPHRKLPLDYYNLVFDAQPIMFISDSTEVVTLQANAVNFRMSAVWTGTPQTEMLQSLVNELDPIVSEQQIFVQQANDPNASAELRMEAKKKYNESAMAAAARLKKWIVDHESQPAALVALMSLQAGTELALYKNEVALLQSKVGHTELFAIAKSEAEKAEKMLLQDMQTPQSSVISKGATVPEIALNDPGGNLKKLSDLKGKVVLIDFWASWCGPCRKENPNVVKAYNKYAGDGFEVFSVSLDNAADRWKQAIQQDGLIWPNHVSDLKGWSSTAASDYGVRSIPFPVLIDKEGKVISFGGELRGNALETLLHEIYGH